MAILRYDNTQAIRNRKITKTLETKLITAVDAVFGKDYTVSVYSGGQASKAEIARTGKGKRTGSRRHDDVGKGGRAADVYILGPDRKRITQKAKLDKLKDYWLKNKLGSVGVYMSGMGMHLDEFTRSMLLRGEGLYWEY